MAAVQVPVKLGAQVVLAWVLALLAAGFCGMVALILARSPLGLPLRALGCAVLALLPLWLLRRALGEALGWLQLGSAALELAQPLQPGVPQQARLRFGRSAPADAAVRVRCQTIENRRSGGKNETSIATRWEAALPAHAQGDDLLLDFALPADEPPAEPRVAQGTYHRWRLDVKRAGWGGFDFSLDLPVEAAPPEVLAQYQAQRSARVHSLAQEALAGHADAAAADGLLPPSIVLDNGAQGLVLEFGAARNRPLALPMLLFGAIFSLVVVGLAWLGQQPGKQHAPLIFHIVFGLFGGGLLAGGLYLSGASIRTVVDAAGIRTRRAWYGLASERFVEAGGIREIAARSTLRSGERDYYTLTAVDYDGRATTIGSGIPGAYAAQFLREVVAGKLGLPASASAGAPEPFGGGVRALKGRRS